MCNTCDSLRVSLREAQEELKEWRSYAERSAPDSVTEIRLSLGVSPQVAKVMDALMSNPSTVVTTERLIEAMEYNGQGRDFLACGHTDESRALNVNIHSARRALERAGIFDAIGNMRGVGYIMPKTKVREIRRLIEERAA